MITSRRNSKTKRISEPDYRTFSVDWLWGMAPRSMVFIPWDNCLEAAVRPDGYPDRYQAANLSRRCMAVCTIKYVRSASYVCTIHNRFAAIYTLENTNHYIYATHQCTAKRHSKFVFYTLKGVPCSFIWSDFARWWYLYLTYCTLKKKFWIHVDFPHTLRFLYFPHRIEVDNSPHEIFLPNFLTT